MVGAPFSGAAVMRRARAPAGSWSTSRIERDHGTNGNGNGDDSYPVLKPSQPPFQANDEDDGGNYEGPPCYSRRPNPLVSLRSSLADRQVTRDSLWSPVLQPTAGQPPLALAGVWFAVAFGPAPQLDHRLEHKKHRASASETGRWAIRRNLLMLQSVTGASLGTPLGRSTHARTSDETRSWSSLAELVRRERVDWRSGQMPELGARCTRQAHDCRPFPAPGRAGGRGLDGDR